MSTKVKINTTLLDRVGDEQLPKSVAYVFSANGRLLGQKPLEEKGGVSLEVAAKEGSRLIVVVGPEVAGKATLAELRRRGGVEHSLRPDAQGVLELDAPIARDRWAGWLLGLCFVEGYLYKHFTFGPLSLNLPVPNALVEIYEVDPFPRIIWQLPDDFIERLREYVLRPIPIPDPPPIIVSPIPPPDPPPFAGFNPETLRSGVGFAGSGGAAVLPTSERLEDAAGELSLKSASVRTMSYLRFLAENTSTLQFRQVLVANPAIVRPLLCILFPISVTMQLVATATTDECGHFGTFFFKGINNPDTPDLYFRAKQQIHPGPMTTIYAPTPIPCYTYWDYACGTEVTLYTTHPEAIAKTPCADLSDGIIVDRIGDYPLSKIRGTSHNLQPTTSSANLGLTEAGAPWGGALRLRLEFDPDLPTTDVNYYRVSYRKHGDSDPAHVSILNAPVTWTAVLFPAVGDPIYSPYDIGPKTAPNGTPNLYEIHSRGNAAPGGIGFWSAQNFGGVVANNTNAIFDTTVPAGAVLPSEPDKAGQYDLLIELFNANGDPINPATEGIKFYVPPSLAGDTTADDASTLGLMEGTKFVFALYVDNNPPVADVQEPTIGAQGAGSCGALEYTSDAQMVDIPFIGGQRNGFSSYSFSIRKGGSDIFAVPSTAAGVGSHTLVRHITQSVGVLRGTCPVAGLRAAVAVHPTATTGWGAVYSDVSDDYAFALAPELP